MDDIFSKQANTSTTVAFGSRPRQWLGWILLLVVVITLAAWYAVNQYNTLQRQDELVDAQWSNVLNQYSRRADLIPNLVSVVKSYASHESTLFKEITDARAKLTRLSNAAKNSRDPQIYDQFQETQNHLSASLSRLLIVTEKYPDLKASELYRDLMAQLEGAENRISYSRQQYIAAVAEYNFGIRRFPNNLLARQAGYKPRAKFTVENESIVISAPPIDLK